MGSTAWRVTVKLQYLFDVSLAPTLPEGFSRTAAEGRYLTVGLHRIITRMWPYSGIKFLCRLRSRRAPRRPQLFRSVCQVAAAMAADQEGTPEPASYECSFQEAPPHHYSECPQAGGIMAGQRRHFVWPILWRVQLSCAMMTVLINRQIGSSLRDGFGWI